MLPLEDAQERVKVGVLVSQLTDLQDDLFYDRIASRYAADVLGTLRWKLVKLLLNPPPSYVVTQPD